MRSDPPGPQQEGAGCDQRKRNNKGACKGGLDLLLKEEPDYEYRNGAQADEDCQPEK